MTEFKAGDRVTIINQNIEGEFFIEGRATLIRPRPYEDISENRWVVMFVDEENNLESGDEIRYVDPEAQSDPEAFVAKLNAFNGDDVDVVTSDMQITLVKQIGDLTETVAQLATENDILLDHLSALVEAFGDERKWMLLVLQIRNLYATDRHKKPDMMVLVGEIFGDVLDRVADREAGS